MHMAIKTGTSTLEWIYADDLQRGSSWTILYLCQWLIWNPYAEHTIPHMLNGKAISRATCGHLLISGVLHGMIVPNITAQFLMRKADVEKQQLLHFSDYSKLNELPQCVMGYYQVK